MIESGKLHDAIAEALAGESGGRNGFLARWALVAEYVAPDGDRWLHRAVAPNMAPWDAAGLWHEALYGTWHDEASA